MLAFLTLRFDVAFYGVLGASLPWSADAERVYSPFDLVRRVGGIQDEFDVLGHKDVPTEEVC